MSAFTRISCEAVPSLRLNVETWRHPCGMTHVHLACEDQHRAFAVAFRTQPHDSTGLPHILEHTTLCGSKKYPVRDPFFNMLRRSLQTFMNAMTWPDFTAYPFASQVDKDFKNLLGVYLDAVFAPNLHPLDFAQEGHRLTPVGDTWERQGVVFNEMKGAMDGTSEQLGMAISRALLPDTPYRHNYGGEPTDIPALTHADLVAFHRRCYTPANACVFTYGAVELPDLHQRLMSYIDSSSSGSALPFPPLQAPLKNPVTVDVPVPYSADQDELDVSAASLVWTWGDGADIDEALEGELIDRVLMGHAGAPLRLALESSGLGRSFDGSGYGGSGGRNGGFTVQLNGVAVADYPRFEPLVFESLKKIIHDGIAPTALEAALHQLELARREIHGDQYPYGLELCFRLFTAWNTGVALLPHLDQAPAIARLRTRFANPASLVAVIRQRFIDHPHRGLFFARPDTTFHDRQNAAIAAGVTQSVAHADRAALVQQAEALAKRQASKDDPSVLPRLELSDVPAQRRWAEPSQRLPQLTIFTPGTNGILHHLIAMPIPELSERELDILPLLTQTMGHLGVGQQSYAERSAWLTERCAGISTWTDIVADAADTKQVRAWWCMEVRGLAHRHHDFAQVLHDTLEHQRFDEHDRLRELIEQSTQRLQERVQGAGNAFAARAAARGFGGAASIGHRLSGLGRLAWLKKTAASIAADAPNAADHLAHIADDCRRLLQRFGIAPRQTAVIGDAAEKAEVLARLRVSTHHTAPSAFVAPCAQQAIPSVAWTTATAVNYCALAFPTVPMTHADAPALSVAGRMLVNQILHPRIREQGGAYGSGAGYSAATGTFTLTSYRDPRLAATFDDLRYGLQWLRDHAHERLAVEEAVLGVMADIDTPGSPAGEARSRFAGELKNITPAVLDEQRRRVLAVTAEAINRAAQRWLDPQGGISAAVTSSEALAKSPLGWAAEAI